MSLFLRCQSRCVDSSIKTKPSAFLPVAYFRRPIVMVALLALVLVGLAVPSARATASLMGEQVTLTVRYQVSPQGGGYIDHVLYTSTFTVGSGAEVSSQPVSFTYVSGGYNQTISGTISADVGANTMSVNFNGTQQPGGLLFVLSSVTDQSAAGISSATLSSSSGFQDGINLAEAPSYDNSGDGSVTANYFLGGYQPGVNLSENISFGLVTSPTVTTAAATGVTASSATLNGSVNANGASTTATFDYGLTTAYGNSAAASPGTVTGSTTTPISASLTGLIPGATYHYRAVGTVPGGVGNGADQTFTIPATATVSVLGTPAWTDSGATLASFTVPAGNNRVLVVAASGENVNGDPAINLTGVTFNGSAMTQGVKANDGAYVVDGLWYVPLGTSASATTANIVVTPSSVTTVSSIGAVTFQNVNQTTPLNSFQSDLTTNETDIASSVTVTGSSGDLVMDLLDDYDPGTDLTRTPGAGQTAAFTGGDLPTVSGAEFYVSTLKLGAASVPMTWTTTGQETIQLAANIKQATAVNVAPAITTQPANQTVNAGATAIFNAAASGTPTPTVQWQVSTDGGASFSNLSGATSTPLSFATVAGDDGNQYRAVFTNIAGSATNTPATLTVIGPPAKLAFFQQPTSTTAGNSITPAVTVQIQDAAGRLTASTAVVTLAINNNPAGGTLSGTAAVNAVAGVATFNGLSIDKAGTGYTLGATSTTLTSATSLSFNISAGAATKLSLSAPANAIAGAAFNFTVTALDAFNNPATGYSGTAHFTSTDGAAVLPANATLTSGAGTFSATLKTSGSRTITATDTVSPSITGASGNIAVASAAATHFAVSAPANVTAGSAFSFTVTALDAFNNPATGYNGTAHFTSIDGTAVLPANSTLTSGAGTFSATLKTSGAQTIAATDTDLAPITGTSGNIIVAPAAASHFTVSAPATAAAGGTFNFTVTALDAFNNTATDYSGTAHFTSTDGTAVLPANSTLTSGAGTFSATLKTSGTQTIAATDTVSPSITGTSGNIIVAPAAATHFAVSAPANATAGTALSFTVTALDAFNNTATGYGGTAHFVSTDAAAVLPANATLASGAGTFSATLKTAGTQTIAAMDTVLFSINGATGNITVAPAAASHLATSAPAATTAGTAFSFTVTALDAFNNTATGYGGVAHFTSTDAAAVLPADATLTSGAGTFSATLKTAGTQTIAVADTVSPSIAGTSGTIVVAPAAASHFAVSAPTNSIAGTTFDFTVTALDAFDNTATGYSGTAHFTSTDGTAVLPADAALANGTGTFNATLKTAGAQAITATDTVSPLIAGTSGDIIVAPATATQFTVSTAATATAGTAFNFTVTALDAFNNTATGYSGTAHFTSTDAQVVLPADATLTNGTGTFSATLKTAGAQAITATDTVSPSITGISGNIIVAPAAASHLTVSAPASAIAGTAFNFAVTALDAFNNIATGYSGPAHFTSTDGTAVLPADATLTGGVGTFSATLKTSGTQTITAMDTVSPLVIGTSGNIAVAPAAATHLAVSAPANATAGTPFSFTVTALDQFNNTATGYNGTAHFTSTDGTAVLPADATLTGGVGIFGATLKTSGTQTITATDTVSPSITGTSGNIAVGSAAATHFVVDAPAVAKARISTNLTVTALDAYGNTATGYAGTVHFTSTDSLAALPGDATLTNGVQAFSLTMGTAGIQTVTATDTANSSVTGSSDAIEVLDLQIVVPPASVFVLPGTNPGFSVAVSGTAPFAYQWLANNAAVTGATNSTLIVSNVTLLTATNYQVIITNAWGSLTSSVATLTISGVFNYTNTLQVGAANLNTLTGLYEEQVNVTNVGGPFSGLRLLVGNLPSRVSLYHPAGTNNGLPYVDFAVTMAPGQTGTFLLQFLDPYRLKFTNTVQVVALNAGPVGSTGTTNTVTGIPISKVLIDSSIPGSPRFTLAFTSVVGQHYQVLYSDDVMQTWTLADTITANATWTIWTEVLPASSGSRFFKVIIVP